MTASEKHDDELRAAFQIARKLVKQSREGKIKWSEAGSDFFWTVLAGNLVGVGSVDGDGRQPFRISFQDSNGTVIQQIDSTEAFEEEDASEWPVVLEDLYKDARRRGRKFNKMIDEINTALDRQDPDIPF
jgi:hypothetical protein